MLDDRHELPLFVDGRSFSYSSTNRSSSCLSSKSRSCSCSTTIVVEEMSYLAPSLPLAS